MCIQKGRQIQGRQLRGKGTGCEWKLRGQQGAEVREATGAAQGAGEDWNELARILEVSLFAF